MARQVRELQAQLDKDGATMTETDRRNKERDLANLSRDMQRAQREFAACGVLAELALRALQVARQVGEALRTLLASVGLAHRDACSSEACRSRTCLPTLLDSASRSANSFSLGLRALPRAASRKSRSVLTKPIYSAAYVAVDTQTTAAARTRRSGGGSRGSPAAHQNTDRPGTGTPGAGRRLSFGRRVAET